MYLTKVKIGRNWLRIFGLVLFVVILIKLDLRRILQVILKVEPTILAITLCLTVPLMMLQSWRWRYLLAMQNVFLSLKESFLVYLGAFYVGVITPARVGEFIKVLYLRKEHNMSIGEGLSNILIDRLQDISAFVIVGLIGIALAPLGGSYFYLIFGIAFLFLAMWVFLYRAKTSKKISIALVRSFIPGRYRSSIDMQLDSFFTGISKLVTLRIIIPSIATVVLIGLIFLQCYLIAISLSISISFVYLAFSVSVASLVSFIPVSISGLGTREATLVALFSRVGLSPESAVGFSLIYLLVFNIFIAIIGAVFWFFSPIGIEMGKTS